MNLSIIIPCHNLENYIQPLLNSIDYQRDYTYSDIEIIFVLDDCVDKTDTILSNWIETAPINCTILYVNVHSCGLARNAGVERAKGKYIWFIDGDDWIISNTAFEDILSWINNNNNTNYLHLKWSSNHFHIPEFNYTVWQWIIKTDIAKAIPFDSIQPSEDIRFFERAFQQFPPLDIQTTLYPMYFYNYGRELSNMTQLQEKGHIDL